jgi:hypothetical protein
MQQVGKSSGALGADKDGRARAMADYRGAKTLPTTSRDRFERWTVVGRREDQDLSWSERMPVIGLSLAVLGLRRHFLVHRPPRGP